MRIGNPAYPPAAGPQGPFFVYDCIMETLYQILESMQELYHFTDGTSLVNILKTDTFTASHDDGYNPKGYDYFMSTTRMQYAGMGYPASMLASDLCKIVLKGRILNSQFKIIPVNFQGNVKVHAIRASWDDPKQFDDYKDERMRQPFVEAEDRVLLRRPAIKDFHKYIERIYIDTNTIDPREADDIIRYAEQLKIPVDVTFTTKEFMMAH